MSKNVPFELTFDLATPVVMPFQTTLDGLLSYAAAAMTGLEGEELVPHIPLALDQESRIFKASSIFLGPQPRYMDAIKVRSMRSADDLDARSIAPRRTAKGIIAKTPYPQLDKKRGDFANKMSRYITVQVPYATCYGVGRPDEVMLLLELIGGLGRFANQGQGEITGRSIRQITHDRSWISTTGQPNRPIPVATWERVSQTPVDDVTHGPAHCRFPYWETPSELCVMPRRVVQ